MVKKIKAVFFDLDNTFYTYQVCNEYAQEQVFKKINRKYKLNSNLLKKYFEQARAATHGRLKNTAASHHRLFYFQTLIEKLAGKTNSREVLELYHLFWKSYFKKMKLLPGWKKLLMDLKNKNIKTLILTDLTAQVQFEKLKKLKIDHLIDFVVTSEEVGEEKPSPQVFIFALKKSKCKPKEVVMVGDDLSKDIRGSKRLGIDAVHIKTGGTESAKVRNYLFKK